MKYICLIYFDEKKLETMSKNELDAFMEECLVCDVQLKKSGHAIACQLLEPIQTATTVRVRRGRVTIVDGPFAETKEQLGGFVLINARDLNEAIQVASKIPPARFGSVEVRPISELNRRSLEFINEEKRDGEGRISPSTNAL